MNRGFIFLTFIFCLLFSSCSPEETDADISEVAGTVVGTAVCNTDNKNVAYKIKIENMEAPAQIITATLPAQFHEKDLKITFDMEKSSEGFTICAAIYDGKIFYKVSNVREVE